MQRAIPLAAARAGRRLRAPRLHSEHRAPDLRPSRRRDGAPVRARRPTSSSSPSTTRASAAWSRWSGAGRGRGSMHATVIDYLAAAGAKVIGYDVLFAERDIRKFMVADTEWTGEESDAALVESTKQGRQRRAHRGSVERRADRSVARADARTSTRRRSTCACRRRLRRAPPARDAAVSGARRRRRAASATRCSSSIRTAPCGASSPVVQVGDRTIPSFSLATAMAAGTTPALDARHRRQPATARSMIPWRGPGAKTATASPPSRRIRSTTSSIRSSRSSKGRSPASIPRSSRIASSSSAAPPKD